MQRVISSSSTLFRSSQQQLKKRQFITTVSSCVRNQHSEVTIKHHPRHEFMLLQSKTSNIKSHQTTLTTDENGKPVPKLLSKDKLTDGHRLLTANSFIKSASSGLYTVLPYGERVMEKVIRLIDSVMQQPGPSDQAVNGTKVAMPVLSHKRDWERTGRWEVFGSEMYRLKDRKDSDYCLCPTHEEVVTELFDSSNFPARIYQIGRKFRDESWPKNGLLRGKEFIMKDLYSFDKDVESAQVSYRVMVKAYKEIFNRLGLNYLVVEGDTGNIGGNLSHEFHSISTVGEDQLLHCTCSGSRYAANVEMAKSIIDANHLQALNNTTSSFVKNSATEAVKIKISADTLSKLIQPDMVSIFTLRLEKLVNHQKVVSHALAIVPKGSQVNDVKAKKILSVDEVACTAVQTLDLTSNLVLLDRSLISLIEKIEENQVDGSVNVAIGDTRIAKKGELCCSNNPQCCNAKLEETKGIEIGHVFYLGTKYSSVFNTRCTDSNGVSKLAEMGCYGIGVSRVMQAVIESSNDKYGPIWPFAIAPYRAIVINTFPSKEGKGMRELEETAQSIYDSSVLIYDKVNQLSAFRNEVLYFDDMRARLSEKLRYAESVGIPYLIIIGNNFLKTGKYEVKNRKTGEMQLFTLEETVQFFQNISNNYEKESYYGF